MGNLGRELHEMVGYDFMQDRNSSKPKDLTEGVVLDEISEIICSSRGIFVLPEKP
ncbi:hypothetical protein FVER14953_20728 [Fusarium verticillioides]|nr:hypothetical protein FVER14953_20728 [Fusarium verticillioides]